MAIGPQMAIPLRARGGVLPQYEQREGDYAGGAGVSGRLSDTGAELAGQAARVEAQGGEAIAKSVSGLQRPFEQLAGAGIAYIGAYNAQQDLDARRALMEYQTSAMQYQSELEKRKGVDARGTEKNMAAFLEKQRNELGKKYKLDPRAGRWFNWQTYQEAGKYNSWASEYGHRQLGVEYEAVYKDQMSVASNEVARDPSTFGANVGKLLVLLEQKNVYGTGMTGDREENKRAISDFLASGAISAALGNGDAQRANELFAQLSPYLSEVQKGKLNDSVATALTKDLASRAELGEAVGLPSGGTSGDNVSSPAGGTGGRSVGVSSGGGTQASSLTKNKNQSVMNNNPFGYGYTGKQGEYNKFPDMETALKVYVKQLGIYQSKHGIRTWYDAAYRWLSGKNSPNYAAAILKRLNWSKDKSMDLNNREDLAKFLWSQGIQENSLNWTPQQVAAMLAGRGSSTSASPQYGQTQQSLTPTQFGGGVTLSAAQMADISNATRKGQIVRAKRAAIEFFSSDPSAVLKMTHQQVGDAVGATTPEGMWAANETAWGLYGQTEHARLTRERADLRAAWENDVEPVVRGGDFFAAHDRIDALNVSGEVKQDLHAKVERFQSGALARTYRRNSRDLYASIMAFEGNEAELQQKVQDAFDNDNIGLSEYQRAMSLVKNRYSPYAKALKDFVTQSTALMKDPSILDTSGFGEEFFRESFEKAVDAFNRLSADEKKIEMRDIREGLRDPKARSKSLVLSMLDGDIASYKDAQTRQALMAQWDAKKREEAANQHEAEVRNAIRFLRTGQGTQPSPAIREEAKGRMEEEARQTRQEAARAKQEARAKEQAAVTPQQRGEQERQAARARGVEARGRRRASFLYEDISSEEVSAAAEAIGGAVSLGERAARPIRKAITPPLMWMRRNVSNSVEAIMGELSREAQEGE